MRYSEILKNVRRNIENGAYTHICLAIRYSSYGSVDQRLALESWVMSFIEPTWTLKQWLKVNYTLPELVDIQTKMRHTRCEWLTWMIDTLESEGK